MRSKVYGVIAEFKNQAPIIMESEITTEDAARDRMRGISNQSNCIRAAVFVAVYESGNKSLLPDESPREMPF